MARFPCVVFACRLNFAALLASQRTAQAVRSIGRFCFRTKVRKAAFAAGFLSVVLAVTASPFASRLTVLASELSLHPQLAHRVPAGILVTGSNGSSTGIASFLGNLTGIEQTSPNLFLIQRQTDCSLNLLTGSSAPSGSTVTLTLTGNTPHFEQTLHQLTGLTTTADLYPSGCAEKNAGISSRPGVFVGMPQTGTLVSATVISNGGGAAVRSRVYKSPYTSVPQNIDATLINASALATADLNVDGNGDLVVVNGNFATSSYIAVMLGKSDGTFQPAVSYNTAGNYTVAAVVDDLNDDAKQDIVAVSADQQISVLLGNGNGTFQTALSFAAPVLPGYTTAAQTPIVSLITADVNGDSKTDVICSNGLVLLGKADGTFNAAAAPAFPYVVNSLTSEGPILASGDVNKDGKIDIAVSTGTSVAIWKGNGNGTFTEGKRYAGINTTGFITISDLDGDGNLDIYVGMANGGQYSGDDYNASKAYVLMGNGDGSFQGAPALNSGAYSGNNLVDLNADGYPDLITLNNGVGQQTTLTGSLTVRLGNNKGEFTQGANIAPQASFSLNGYNFTMGSSALASSFAVGDVTGDNKPDVLFVDNGLTAINPGSGLPITYPYPVYFVAVGNGDGTFQTAVPYAFPQIAPAADFDNSNTVTNLQIADANHDNVLDVIAVYNETAGGPGAVPYNQGIVVLPGNGNGTFKAPVLTSTYSSASAPTTAIVPKIMTVIDLTGDNNSDVIVNVPGTAIINFQLQTQLQLFVSNGDGTFKTPTTIAVGANTYATAFADFNNDSKMDLAVLAETSSAQAELVILTGNGNGTFGTAAVSNLAGADAIRSTGLAAADFDGDGKSDIAILDPNDYSGVFYGNGNGTFTSIPVGGNIVPKNLLIFSAGAPAIAVDLNKDSKPDILAGGVSLINTTGTSTSPASSTTALSVSINPSVVGSSLTFTAAVTGTAGTPNGTVTFKDGSTTLGTGSLTAGVATYATSALTIGSHSITAVYSGDSNFNGSTSNTVTQVVNKATPTVTVTPSPTSITIAQTAAVTVVVTGTVGNSTPTGSVTLAGGGYTSAATSLASGSATIDIPAGALTVGTDTLTVSYTPDFASSSTYNTATGSNTVTVTLGPTFALSSGAIIAVTRGATSGNTSTVTVTPSGGFAGAVALTAALTTTPSGAANLPILSFGSTTPVNITSANPGTATLTVSTTAATSAALVTPRVPNRWYASGGVALACLLLFGIPARRRLWRNLLGMFLLLAFVTCAIVSCGGGGGNSGGGGGNPGTTAGSYVVTVTGTSGSTTNTTTVNLTVN